MYTVTDQEKEAYKQDGSIKRGYISVVPLSEYEEEVTLDDVKYLKSFTILDDIYTPEQGVIGSVIAKQLSLELFTPIIKQSFPITYEEVEEELTYDAVNDELTYDDYGNITVERKVDLVDREVDVYIGIEIYNTTEEGTTKEIKYIPYGRYIIQKPENGIVNETTKFEALDYMIKFNKPFEDTIETYPCTVKDFFTAICNQCGVSTDITEFTNSDFEIEQNPFVSGETCRDVLKAIAQISGSYARIGRDNKLYLSFPNNQNIETITSFDYMSDIKINNTYRTCK